MNLRTILLALVIVGIGLIWSVRLPEAVVRAESRSIQEQTSVAFAPHHEAGAMQDSNKRDAKRGVIASGLVLTTAGGELHLNIRPCEGQPFVVIFREPYNRSVRGQKNCAGQNVTIEQIQQN